MSKPFTLHFTATAAEDGITLRDFLAQHHISKAACTDIKLHGGALTVNGKPETVRYVIKHQDQIAVQYPPETSSLTMKAEAIPLSIVYEDDAILVVDKPVGLCTIPSRKHPSGTLANGILHHYAQTDHAGAVHFVTRLDFDTSGLVLVAKHRYIHALLSLAMQKQALTKEYLALVEGTLIPPNGTVDLPIARVNISQIKREVHPDGLPAQTKYRTVQQIQTDTHTYSLVRLQLLTGRTHQIRVHMTALQHPLLGDCLYGGNHILISRHALHCNLLKFLHPMTGELMRFESPLPAAMERLIL